MNLFINPWRWPYLAQLRVRNHIVEVVGPSPDRPTERHRGGAYAMYPDEWRGVEPDVEYPSEKGSAQESLAVKGPDAEICTIGHPLACHDPNKVRTEDLRGL